MEIFHWHPSVLSDYGIARWKHLLLWLERPILEWQSFPHVGQINVEICCPSYCFLFLLLLFCSLLDVSVSSKVSRPSFTALLQADLSLAKSFPRVFIDVHGFQSCLHTSLNCSCGLIAGRRFLPPVHHTECRLGFCLPPFYKHATAIAGVAVSIESTCLADLLSQEPQCWELCLARPCSRWKGLSLCSCRACSTQDSLPYRSVLSTHALFTWILGFSVIFPFFQTLFVRLDMVVEALSISLWVLCRRTVFRRLWILGRQNHGPFQVDDWRLLNMSCTYITSELLYHPTCRTLKVLFWNAWLGTFPLAFLRVLQCIALYPLCRQACKSEWVSTREVHPLLVSIIP